MRNRRCLRAVPAAPRFWSSWKRDRPFASSATISPSMHGVPAFQPRQLGHDLRKIRGHRLPAPRPELDPTPVDDRHAPVAVILDLAVPRARRQHRAPSAFMGAMKEALVTGSFAKAIMAFVFSWPSAPFDGPGTRSSNGALVALEILDGALVFLGRLPRGECPEISALSRRRILRPGIQPITARLQFCDHAWFSFGIESTRECAGGSQGTALALGPMGRGLAIPPARRVRGLRPIVNKRPGAPQREVPDSCGAIGHKCFIRHAGTPRLVVTHENPGHRLHCDNLRLSLGGAVRPKSRRALAGQFRAGAAFRRSRLAGGMGRPAPRTRVELWKLLGRLPPRPKLPNVEVLSREDRGDYTVERFQFDNGAGSGHDIGYFVPGMLNHFDSEAVVALTAPRPILFQTGDRDPGSPVDGIRAIEKAVRPVYRLYGKEGSFQRIIDPGLAHVYTPEMWARTSAWMDDHLRAPAPQR